MSLEIHLSLNSRQSGLIQGESQSVLHAQEIEVASFQWGATNSAVRSAAGSTKAGKASVSEITVRKHLDKATPQLFNLLVSSQLIKTATLSMTKSTGGGKPEDFLTITMTGVFVTSIDMETGKNEGEVGSEKITLSFQTVSIDYKTQGLSGLLTTAGSASYDLTKGQ